MFKAGSVPDRELVSVSSLALEESLTAGVDADRDSRMGVKKTDRDRSSPTPFQITVGVNDTSFDAVPNSGYPTNSPFRGSSHVVDKFAANLPIT